MLCTLHGAALPSNVTWIVPRLVAKSATTVLVGVGFGSGGNPVFFKFGFWARSALVYPHGPVVLLETNAEGDEDADHDDQDERSGDRRDQHPSFLGRFLLLSTLQLAFQMASRGLSTLLVG